MNGEAISERRNVQGMLAEAERAASTGDLVSADELLRGIAQIQKTELGPFHPELANTLNNLAIVSEKRGRPHDAEAFYRQAVEIASASLAPGDPMVIASRQNLEDFRRAQGLPIEKPAVIAPARAEAAAPPTPTTEAPPSLGVSRNALRAAPVSAIGIAALVIALFLMGRPRTTRPELTTVPAAEPAPAPTADSAPPAHAPIVRTLSPAPTVERAPAPVAVTLANAQLCRNFSRSDWRCVPAGDSVAPGTIVLYTRLRSPRDGVIVYRWYRGDALRKSARLRIGANSAEGYRTYSQQTVDPGDWRVEVRSAGGDLLHEQRFAVR